MDLSITYESMMNFLSFHSRWDREKPASVFNLILLKFIEVCKSLSALTYWVVVFGPVVY